MDIANFNLNSPSECRNALDLNERFIHRYLELLDNYVLLPGYEDLIATTLRKEFPKDFLDSLDSFTYLPPPGDPQATGDALPGFEDGEPPPEAAEEQTIPEAELPPAMRKLRQIEEQINMVQNIIYQLLLDWCNLYAAVLPHALRIDGMKVLTTASLILAYTRSTLDQISLFQYVMCQQLIRRAITENQLLLKLLGQLQHDDRQLAALLSSRMESIETIGPCLEQIIQDFQTLQDNEAELGDA